ncbi:uncharacterized protein LOC126839505 isoform X1 [Adelges cooleyi]|uniref:uncharacterized protein LOC126839505 isoform X1 n=1 Tax=Adelges cooleyi TaxID=133065 RepID=UPI00217F7F8A|nr:uncharacterized protein LOC126839505 isoform X1 [Adelges cooleyi]
MIFKIIILLTCISIGNCMDLDETDQAIRKAFKFAMKFNKHDKKDHGLLMEELLMCVGNHNEDIVDRFFKDNYLRLRKHVNNITEEIFSDVLKKICHIKQYNPIAFAEIIEDFLDSQK